MPNKIVRWNTNAPYTPQGQIIYAQLQEDGSILFADISRMIDGRIAPLSAGAIGGHAIEDDIDLRTTVDHRYLHNQYKADAESWEFHQQCRRHYREAPKS